MMKKLTEVDASRLHQFTYRKMLMEHHKEFDYMLLGKDDNGCDVYVAINKTNIVISTHQSNGWIINRVYYDDGSMTTQVDGRWK